jgi:LacI family transcriptional regulator
LATIQDVARHAGVSTATVSRVISGRGYVSPASREQVLAAADALDYVPNGLARGLKTQRSGLVALLVPEIVNSFYTTISRGVEDVANASGLQVILGNTDESVAKERAYVELMISTRVDGVIIAPAGRKANTLNPLLENSVPTVLVDRSVSGFPADVVMGRQHGWGPNPDLASPGSGPPADRPHQRSSRHIRGAGSRGRVSPGPS